MKQILADKGWIMFYECGACRGGKRQFYNHPDHPGYEIRAKDRTQTFSILLSNDIIAGPCWGYQLEEKLFKHVPKAG